jgi:excisionase family DNA binding protein
MGKDATSRRLELPRLTDIRGASEMLRVSPHTLRKWIRQRRLPVVRLGRAIRFDPRALERFIERNTVDERDSAPSAR